MHLCNEQHSSACKFSQSLTIVSCGNGLLLKASCTWRSDQKMFAPHLTDLLRVCAIAEIQANVLENYADVFETSPINISKIKTNFHLENPRKLATDFTDFQSTFPNQHSWQFSEESDQPAQLQKLTLE